MALKQWRTIFVSCPLIGATASSASITSPNTNLFTSWGQRPKVGALQGCEGLTLRKRNETWRHRLCPEKENNITTKIIPASAWIAGGETASTNDRVAVATWFFFLFKLCSQWPRAANRCGSPSCVLAQWMYRREWRRCRCSQLDGLNWRNGKRRDVGADDSCDEDKTSKNQPRGSHMDETLWNLAFVVLFQGSRCMFIVKYFHKRSRKKSSYCECLLSLFLS